MRYRLALLFSLLCSTAFAQVTPGTTPLSVPKGGTGAATLTAHGFVLGQGTGPMTSMLCTSAQLAIGQSAANPACTTLTGDVTLSSGGVTAIGANRVTLGMHAPLAADSAIGNPTGASATPSFYTFPNCSGALTYSTTSHSFACNSVAGTGTVSAGGNDVTLTASGATANVEQMNPGGRLTLASATPVMAASQTAATNLYYAPYTGKYVPLYTSGVGMRLLPFTANDTDAVGLTLALGSNWATNSNYDAFVYVNGSSAGLCTGPDWSQGAVAGSNAVGASSRGTGAGSTQLQLFKSFQTNQNSMTCRTSNSTTVTCAVNECTYIGTFRTGAAGQISFTYGAQGTAGTFNLWNAFNREYFCSSSNDPASTGTYSYSSGTIRQADGSSLNQFNFVTGSAGSSIDASYYLTPRSSTLGAQYNAGLAVNSTTTIDAMTNILFPGTTNFNATIHVSDAFKGVLGANFISANEYGDGTNSITVITQSNFNSVQKLKACLFM